MKITPRRAWSFVRAFVCVLQIHRTLEREGFAGAQKRFLRDWKTGKRRFPIDAGHVQDMEWAIERACLWQWKRSACLHRALASYTLLRAYGAQPHFLMAIMQKPFASHAWVELEGRPIADAAMNNSRYHYKVVLRVPNG